MHKYHEHSAFHRFRGVSSKILERLHALSFLNHDKTPFRHHRITPALRCDSTGICIQSIKDSLIEIPLTVRQGIFNNFITDQIRIVWFCTHEKIYGNKIPVLHVIYYLSALALQFREFHCHTSIIRKQAADESAAQHPIIYNRSFGPPVSPAARNLSQSKKYQPRAAITSTSTRAPLGNAFTATAERAGNGWLKNCE